MAETAHAPISDGHLELCNLTVSRISSAVGAFLTLAQCTVAPVDFSASRAIRQRLPGGVFLEKLPDRSCRQGLLCVFPHGQMDASVGVTV